VAFARACGGDAAEWERRWKELVTADAPQAEDARGAPYVGLAAYRAEDAEWFHGREALVDDLAARVAAQRFVTVVGPSGSGKSSLLRAGLIPRLTASGSPVVLFTPGDDDALTVVDRDAVMVVDQFEEVFTLRRDPDARTRFIRSLLAASQDGNRVVIGVRADFYGRCLLDAELAAAARGGHVAVGPMTVDELRRAILHPARRAGCAVESALLAALITQATGNPGVLPLLSHALLETWRNRKGNTLTLAGYQRTGGIDGALARTADGVFDALDPAGQEDARTLFPRLVELGEGTEDTKRRVARTELAHGDGGGTALDRFTAARLLVVTESHVELAHEALIGGWPRLRTWLTDDRDGLRLHRRLTEATGTWLQHDRDPGSLLRGARLSLIADWAGERAGLSDPERDLVAASLRAEDQDHHAVQRRARVLRGLIVLLVVLLVVTGTTAIRATTAEQRQRDVATALTAVRDAFDLLDTDPGLAAQISLAAHRLSPTPATEEALIAAAAAATPLRVTAPTYTVIANAHGDLLASPAPGPDTTTIMVVGDRRATDVVTLRGGQPGGAFSPDGRLAVTVDARRTARLWDLTAPADAQELATLPGRALAPRFSPDGRLLVTTDAVLIPPDRWISGLTSRLWDISDPRHPRAAGALPGAAAADVVFGEDARTLLTIPSRTFGIDEIPGDMPDVRLRTVMAIAPHESRLWDLTNPRWPRLTGDLRGSGTGSLTLVDAAAFGREGRLLALVGDEPTLWDLRTRSAPRHITTARGHRQAARLLARAPDGRAVAGVGDGTITLWDTAGATVGVLKELRRSRRTVPTQLVYDPSGAAIRAVTAPQGISTADAGGRVWLTTWHLDPERAALQVCAGTEPISPERWGRHFGDVPFNPPCR
jgi:energy-coupling factor transporter ATP-binding protein EcfA2